MTGKMLKRHIETTGDGSTTLLVDAWEEPYHSRHGAIRESRHVFIQMGLYACNSGPIRILEMGFGTGLNALLSLIEADNQQRMIHYNGIEAFPLHPEEVRQLNYVQQLNVVAYSQAFMQMHEDPWEEELQISPYFTLVKHRKDILNFSANAGFNLLYFDAFGARVQPELWSEAVFATMYNALEQDGIMVTYAAKGSVRRAMQAVGFQVERLPGPPGKREMLRARKTL